jgi:hypothetical protein
VARVPAAILAGLLLSLASAIQKPSVVLPSTRYAVHEQIRARIENTNDRPISICVEYGQWSMNDGNLETTPSPFIVQRKSRAKWNTLIIGPDVGSSRHSKVLEPGESAEFPFRLNEPGNMRLVLQYWPGSRDDRICGSARRDSKEVASETFLVQ